MKKELIIGIDVSKDKLDVCIIEKGSTSALEEKVIGNTPAVLAVFLGELCQRYGQENLRGCLEHTGRYGLYACEALEQCGIPYALVPAAEIRQGGGMSRGKSDRIDALRIAVYAWRYGDRLRDHVLPGETLREASSLLTLRSLYVRMATRLKNALRVFGQDGTCPCAGDSLTGQLACLEKELDRLEGRLAELMAKDPGTARNYSLVRSVKGIGPVTAAALILCTANFTLFREARKFGCYAGLAPFPHQSGKSSRPARTSSMANRKIKTLLHNGAASAIVHDPELRTYYMRKKAEGKHSLSVLNAVACKLVYRVFAVIKRQTPFVNLYQHKLA